MDWPTRRHVVRVYLHDHDWWWKWPFIATALVMWVGALVLLVAPWDRAGSEEHIVGLPTPTTPDLTINDGRTERITSWSSPDEAGVHGPTTATALPTDEVPAESNQPGETTADAGTDVVDREDDTAMEVGSLDSRRGDVVPVLVPPPRSSPSPTGPTPTTTGAPPSTSSTATTTTATTTTTAAASPPTPDPPGPETSTTTTQPAAAETAAPTTKPKGKGNAGRTDTTDDENLSGTKNGKVPPGQRTDERTD